jgi:hypothetical protein
MAKKDKVNLDLLKKLVAELENTLTVAQEHPETDVQGYVAELAKASGLASVVSQEAYLVVKDVYTVIKRCTSGAPPEDMDGLLSELEKVYSGAKGGSHGGGGFGGAN